MQLQLFFALGRPMTYLCGVSKLLRVAVTELAPGDLTLSKEASHYVTRVHRLRVGAELVLFDVAQGVEARATIDAVGSSVRARVGEVIPGACPGLAGLRLYQAIGKGQKLDDVVRSATALGVGRITPVLSERVVTRIDDDAAARWEHRRARWSAIALDAARQSGRSDMPGLDLPKTLSAALEERAEGTHVMLVPEADSHGLIDVIRGWRQLSLWVGPEGGFSTAEIMQLEKAGARAARLGPFVLRTELAAVVALGVALMERR